ncbi:hypothetical protein [Myceligenerans salitolerans]|uniref:YhhN-like protein n=1 Tax=Myceligenerans salitolerans TaxID=1230528 RepID=A0ABS3I538_9MICO|nr:hypothetical protein [Myceligenerans salitolerans]MBO0607726.1 hypothetical protein [Myceligenerans salitolerans]
MTTDEAVRPEARSGPETATASTAYDGAARAGRWRAAGRFLLHLGEMVAAMLAGMLVFGGLRDWSVAALGLTGLLERPDLDAVAMVLDMVVAMTLWMRVRRHGRAAIVEMNAAMAAPFAVLLPLYWTGRVGQDDLMVWGHALMVPAMAAAMLLRPAEYAGPGHVRHGPDLSWLARRWPIALALALFVLTIADGSDRFPVWIVLGVALVYPVVGVLRRAIRGRSMVVLQAAGLAVFAGITTAAAVVDPVTGSFVVAAGLVGHAVWDAFHHRAGAVVWRWYAEACVVYDLLLAAAVVAAAVG